MKKKWGVFYDPEPEERATLHNLIAKGRVDREARIDEIAYQKEGNFTVCVVRGNGRLWVGVSKRNPIDTMNPIRAKMIALSRALTDGEIIMPETGQIPAFAAPAHLPLEIQA